MPDSQDPKQVNNNDLRNAQFGGGLINAGTVNAGQIGGDIYNIHLEQQTVASGNSVQSQNQRQRSQQERDSLEKAYTLQSKKVANLRTALVIETDVSRKFQYEQQLQAEERTLGELGEKLDAVEQQLQAAENSGLTADTAIYIKRPPIEQKCYKAIVQPGALIRIKAPQRMGKTLLLEKILDYSRQQGYETVKLDLKLADNSTLTDLKTFLHWLCVNVSDSLDVSDKVDEYWQESLGLNTSCTRYFQRYLLSNIDNSLVFAIDNFERLFEYTNIFSEFCLLLRSWYETAKQGDRMGKIWKKLRLVVVNSTEAYPTLDINRSPFNVGLAIELPEFNQQQVQEIVKLYELEGYFREEGLSQLIKLVGGHPYLLNEAIANLKSQETSLEELISLAPTEQGIFSYHLRQQLESLQSDSQLKEGYAKVITVDKSVQLNPEITFKLHSLGLVKIVRNDCIASCDLYRQYFLARLE
ncbi:AAA-like domain-containing protein [Nostoc sp. C110]|uniref:AAA-like domain-containing protein n=1 Tax=Nostoc sp. C110 TaxID=3349876 RepID=UPI00370DDB77